MKPKRKSSPPVKAAAPKGIVKVTFRLRYHTNFGQSIFLTGNHDIFGSGNYDKATPLRYSNDESWETTVDVPVTALPEHGITYNYFVRESNGALTHDWGADKKISPALLPCGQMLIVDSWNFAGYYENAFYTKPFMNVLLPGRNNSVNTSPPPNVTHFFRVKTPLLGANQTVCLVGNNSALRNWNVEYPILLDKVAGEDFFTAALDLTNAPFPITYKYGIYDLTNHKLLRLENGTGRTLHDGVMHDRQIIINDGYVIVPADTFKGAGVAIPVFSLRSETGFGVGEFADLKALADWGKQAGLKLIQLLPINDTIATHTWTDSYPYAAISAFALHPLYLNLEKMTSKANQRLLKSLAPERKRLNALDVLDYEPVMSAKIAFIKKIFPLQKKETFATIEYQKFFNQNKHWLVPYAAFCHLRDKFGTADFNQWPRFSKYREKEIYALAEGRSAAREDIDFAYFMQFHLHCQLKEATDYAHGQGLVVKGDLPIGVYRNGCDAWQNPELFCMNMQAGAPPDAFAAKGQNWSFPTYNWPRMQETNFAWWKHRCEQIGLYFDALRIDHVLGFFRIWSIPTHAVEGILGYFVPAIPVKPEEFGKRGIAFDKQRFARPYITDAILREMFQADANRVKNEFLQQEGPGTYALKPEFATQRKVEEHFAKMEANDANEKLKIGIYDLISNVVLLEAAVPSGTEYHFRLGMADTPSFKALDGRVQQALREMSDDYFFRRQDNFWAQQAMEKLPALKRVTKMLVCGEDLGMVPDCVPGVMRQLGLLGLEVQRMPKGSHKEFSYPRDAAYLSVVTPGTHDMSTIRGWWEEEDKNRLTKFYQTELGQNGKPPTTCDAWIVRAIIIQHFESPAMWSIFQLQDLLGMDEKLRRKNTHDERINIPANPKNYWRYRMHLTLEALGKTQAFTEELREYIVEHGR